MVAEMVLTAAETVITAKRNSFLKTVFAELHQR